MNEHDAWIPTSDPFSLDDDVFNRSMDLGLESSNPLKLTEDHHPEPMPVSGPSNGEDASVEIIFNDTLINNAEDFSNHMLASHLGIAHRRISSEPVAHKIDSTSQNGMGPIPLNRLSTADFFFGPEMGHELLGALVSPFKDPIDSEGLKSFDDSSARPTIKNKGLKRNLSEPSLVQPDATSAARQILYQDVLGVGSDESDGQSTTADLERAPAQHPKPSFLIPVKQESSSMPIMALHQSLSHVKVEGGVPLPIMPRPMHQPFPPFILPNFGFAMASMPPIPPPQPPAQRSGTKPAAKTFKRGPVTKCQAQGCTKWCTYGYDGQKPMYCKPHMLPGMVDMASRRCVHDNCRKSSSFAFKGDQPLYCRTHCLEGMVNVVSRQCEHVGANGDRDCTSQPGFGFEGGRPKFCGKHKDPGMLYIRNKCVVRGCGKTKKFGAPGGKASHCRQHAADNMVCAARKRKCDFPGCDGVPTVGAQGPPRKWGRKNALFCDQHKLESAHQQFMAPMVSSGTAPNI